MSITQNSLHCKVSNPLTMDARMKKKIGVLRLYLKKKEKTSLHPGFLHSLKISYAISIRYLYQYTH